MTTVAFCNLGCSKNVVDGEVMIAHLEAQGLKYVTKPAEADMIVVNTCAFIQEAKEEAIDAILEMGRYRTHGRLKTLAVAGCFSQRYRNRAKRLFPEVDLWLGLSDWKEKLASHLNTSRASFSPRRLTGLAATQYLKISDGCSHRCAFCAVPLIRGPFKSRPVGDIVKEARWLEEQGVRECILVSQDTSFYGRDRGITLVNLLERLLHDTGFAWLRLMYLHPRWVGPDLLRLVAAEKRLCSYFDIPLQHIADPVLASMRRAPCSAGIRRLIERIRHTVPDAALRTTFIVGFPGETESHFRALLRFAQWARFDKLGVFPYSPEEGTAAFAMRHRPRSATAQRRCETLMTVQRDISRHILESHVGRTVAAIVDRLSDGARGTYEARTQWDAPEVDGRVFVARCRAKPGDIIQVRISEAGDYDLFARPANDRAGAKSIFTGE